MLKNLGRKILRNVFFRNISPKIYLENLSSKIYLRKFIFEIFSSKFFLPIFIFENLSSKIYLCGENGKSSRKNESMKMKKIASRKIGHERFTTLRTCICFRMCLPPDPIQCHYAPHLYMFSDVLAPRPHSMSFYIKNRTWNSTHFLMNFHDDLHPPDPNQCQNCKNFSIPKGGRGLQIFAGLVLGCIDADFCK